MKTITAQEFIDWISLYTNYRYLTRDSDGTVCLFENQPESCFVHLDPDVDCDGWYTDHESLMLILDIDTQCTLGLNHKIMFVNTGSDWTQDIVKSSHI